MKVFFSIMVFVVIVMFMFVVKADACAAGNLGVHACSTVAVSTGV